MRQVVISILLIIIGFGAQSQNERKFVRQGNKIFMEAAKDTTKIDSVKFSQAETEYRKALEKKPDNQEWNFNLTDALYKQQKFEDATEGFDQIASKMEEPENKARALHNKGNSQLFNNKLDESIETYKEALRLNPKDLDTKYNLSYAQKLKQQQEEQQKKDKDKNKDQDKDKDKKDQDKDNKDQNKDQDQEKKDQQNKDQQDKNKQDQQKDQQQQPQPKISKENAEQLLQALQNDEKKIQEKVKKAQVAKAKKVNVEKDW